MLSIIVILMQTVNLIKICSVINASVLQVSVYSMRKLSFVFNYLKNGIKGYDGNGIDCTEVEANCAQEDICDVHADCVYNGTLRKSTCLCQVILLH